MIVYILMEHVNFMHDMIVEVHHSKQEAEYRAWYLNSMCDGTDVDYTVEEFEVI